MKKLSIILALTVMALFALSVTAMAVEVEHRVYAEFSLASDVSDEYDENDIHYKYEDCLDEGITFGYEAAFATSNKSLKILAGGNSSIDNKVTEGPEKNDTKFFNVYSGVKYQIADNKIKPYLVGRLGLAMMDIDASWFEEADIGLYAGVGMGIKPIEKMSAEVMYLYNKNEYHDESGNFPNCEFTYKRWVLSVGYLF